MFTSTCSCCGESRVKVFSGQFDTQNRKVYVDRSGNKWRGKICPDCKYRGKNSVMITNPDETIELETPKVRYCRKCKKSLPPIRYFNCASCVQVLREDYGLVYA